MGQVKFGSHEFEKGKFRPCIMITTSSGVELVFTAENFYFKNEEDVRACVTDVYMILTGPQSNPTFSKEEMI